MTRDELLAALIETAEDLRLSRSEKRALREVIGETPLDDDDRLVLQRALVEQVAERMPSHEAQQLVHWLGDALALLAPRADRRFAQSRAWFGPEDPMVETVRSVVERARRRLDIAVFTITDDRLTKAILAAADRGVAVRIISDDDKAHDRGSDVFRLQESRVAVAVDRSPHHFHHKFAVADERILLNGSYNWTRGADLKNRENFMITEEPQLVARFQKAFDELWDELYT